MADPITDTELTRLAGVLVEQAKSDLINDGSFLTQLVLVSPDDELTVVAIAVDVKPRDVTMAMLLRHPSKAYIFLSEAWTVKIERETEEATEAARMALPANFGDLPEDQRSECLLVAVLSKTLVSVTSHPFHREEGKIVFDERQPTLPIVRGAFIDMQRMLV